jgi:hypothetical protein
MTSRNPQKKPAKTRKKGWKRLAAGEEDIFLGKGWDSYDPASAGGSVVIGGKEDEKQAGTERYNSTFFGTVRNASQKSTKNVQFRRICEDRQGTEVRDQMQDRDIGGSRGYLLQVKWSFGTNSNPICYGCKA